MTDPGKAITAGVIIVGAAVIETALLPGMVIGAIAILASGYGEKWLKAGIKHGYRAARASREAFAEATEQVHDLVAEVNAEGAPATKADGS